VLFYFRERRMEELYGDGKLGLGYFFGVGLVRGWGLLVVDGRYDGGYDGGNKIMVSQQKYINKIQ
jgi:hypothetical protein